MIYQCLMRSVILLSSFSSATGIHSLQADNLEWFKVTQLQCFTGWDPKCSPKRAWRSFPPLQSTIISFKPNVKTQNKQLLHCWKKKKAEILQTFIWSKIFGETTYCNSSTQNHLRHIKTLQVFYGLLLIYYHCDLQQCVNQVKNATSSVRLFPGEQGSHPLHKSRLYLTHSLRLLCNSCT